MTTTSSSSTTRRRGGVALARFGGSGSTRFFVGASTFFSGAGAGCVLHGQVSAALVAGTLTGAATAIAVFGRLRSRSSSLRAVAREIAVGVLREEGAIAGRGVDDDGIFPRHHAAVAIEPVTGLQAARR